MGIIADFKQNNVPKSESTIYKLSDIENVPVEILTVRIKEQMDNKFGEPCDTAIIKIAFPDGTDGTVFLRQAWLVDIFEALYNQGIPEDYTVVFSKKTSKKGNQYWDVDEC